MRTSAAAVVIALSLALQPARANPGLVELRIWYPQSQNIQWTAPGGVPHLEELHLDGPPDPLLVPRDTRLASLYKTVTYSGGEPSRGSLSLITDFYKNISPDGADRNSVELGNGPEWLQIDLEEVLALQAIAVWRDSSPGRVYHDVVVQASNDIHFKEGVKTLFNNDHDNSLGFGQGTDPHYVETHFGRVIRGLGAEARYVRLWSNGNTDDTLNRIIEVEVYATPADPTTKWLEVERPMWHHCSPREPKGFSNIDYRPYSPVPLVVPESTRLVSSGKPVSTGTQVPFAGDLQMLVDGDKEHPTRGEYLGLPPGLQWVQVDLEDYFTLQLIHLWRNYDCYPVFKDVVVQASMNVDFNGDTITLYNNDHDNSAGLGPGTDSHYHETWLGRQIDGQEFLARYARIWSNGSHVSAGNGYVELEVYASPAKD